MVFKVIIVCAKAGTLKAVEQYLRNRQWEIFVTDDLKEAITETARAMPDFVVIAADHPNRRVRQLPRLLSKFPARLIGFVETNSRSALNALADMEFKYEIFPPVSGPSVERMILRIKKEEEKSKEIPKERRTDRGGGESGGSDIVISGRDRSGEDSNAVWATGNSGEKSSAVWTTGNGEERNAWSVRSGENQNSYWTGRAGGPRSADISDLSWKKGAAKALSNAVIIQKGAGLGRFFYPGSMGGLSLGTPNVQSGAGPGSFFSAHQKGPGAGDPHGAHQRGPGLGGMFGFPTSDPYSSDWQLEDEKPTRPPESDRPRIERTVLPDEVPDTGREKERGRLSEAPKSGSSGEAKGPPALTSAPSVEAAMEEAIAEATAAAKAEEEKAAAAAAAKTMTPEEIREQIRRAIEYRYPPQSYPDKNSLLLQGAEHALDQAVQVNPPIGHYERLQASSKVVCIAVESPQFSGYLVGAMGKNREMDERFTETVRDRLLEFLRQHGENVSKSETMALKLRQVDFEDWAVRHADFLRKSLNGENEVALAFFPNKAMKIELEPSVHEHMMKMSLEHFREEEEVEFDLYIYLPVNDRYLLYTPKGRRIATQQKARLQKKGVSHLHFRKENAGEVTRYLAQVFLNRKIEEYQALLSAS